MSGGALLVRPFEPGDVDAVWQLMRDLAIFEGYIDAFAVTPETLLAHGFGAQPAFGVFVAVVGGTVAGIAVHYRIPWTFDLRPVLVLKELFVAEAFRGRGVGGALFSRLRAHANAKGASALHWSVLPGNEPARRFYAAFGGAPDAAWEHWTLACGGESAMVAATEKEKAP